MLWTYLPTPDQLAMLGLLAVAVWLLTLEQRARQARRLVLGHAALLVAPAMACAGLTALHLAGGTVRMRDNVVALLDNTPHYWPGLSWAAFAVVSLSLAGHIGLLEAHRTGRRPGGQDFLDGIRHHALTIAAGKLLLFGGVFLISRAVEVRSAGILLYLIPSALLAPLPGFASLHPGNAPRALGATLRFSYENLQRVGFRVTLLTGFLVVLVGVTTRPFGIRRFGPEILPEAASALGWNTYPFVQLPLPTAVVAAAAVLAAVVSTVFVTAHWLDVLEHERPARQSVSEAHPT